tara:strand:+ start:787 stop:1116 length:330 start_codon:yes stop_codon:yes gene_type:complete
MKPIQKEKLSEIPVQWVGVSEHVTKRDRTKLVLTGIPGELFWRRFKNDGAGQFRALMAECGVTVRRLAKAQWEVVLWINRHNQGAVEQIGFNVPQLAEVAIEPSNGNPY